MEIEIEMKKLDFAIIGAGKSGTTSLFKYLSAHPGIFMPGVKELSFFAVPNLFARGIDWYYREYFSGAEESLLWGEASPAYMSYASTPANLQENAPDVKLIAILRNPVDRAFSHHQHLVRSGRETQNFGACIQRLVDRGTVSDNQIETTGGWHSEYVMDGEYGRLLGGFLRYFPRDQLKVYFFEDLLAEPEKLMSDLYQWLGVESKSQPDVVGKVYNTGGVLRFPRITKAAGWVIRQGVQVGWINALLRQLGIRSTLAEYWFRFNTEFAVQQKKSEGPTSEERALLAEYYRKDMCELQEILGAKPPWPEFQGKSEEAARATENTDRKNEVAA